MKFFRRCAEDQSGNTLIEFALVAPVFFFLVLGTLEFALILHVSSLVEHATHEGARIAMTGNVYDSSAGSRDANIKQHIRRNLSSWLQDKDVSAEDEQLRITSLVFPDFGSVGVDGEEVGTDSFGGSNQVVMYSVLFQWYIITPFLGEMFKTGETENGDNVFEMSSTVIIKNECFAGDPASCF
ncbi:MAG: pilus assembly protein [Rickettsiales bacterium]|nr:pilus assembly protein [Rickettsiales bacterium]